MSLVSKPYIYTFKIQCEIRFWLSSIYLATRNNFSYSLSLLSSLIHMPPHQSITYMTFSTPLVYISRQENLQISPPFCGKTPKTFD